MKKIKYLIVSVFIFLMLTGCGENDTTTQSPQDQNNTSGNSVMGDAGNAIEDMGEGVGNGISEMGEGVKEGMDEMTGNGSSGSGSGSSGSGSGSGSGSANGSGK